MLNRNWEVVELVLLCLWFLEAEAPSPKRKQNLQTLPRDPSPLVVATHWPVVFSAFHVMTHEFADAEVGDEAVERAGSSSPWRYGTEIELSPRPRDTWAGSLLLSFPSFWLRTNYLTSVFSPFTMLLIPRLIWRWNENQFSISTKHGYYFPELEVRPYCCP